MMSDPRETRSDLETLVREMLSTAKAVLEERGTFAPFGGGLLSDGQIRRIEPAEISEPVPEERLVESLEARLRGGAARHGFRATVAVVNVQVRQPGGRPRDAVQVKLDHAGGVSLELFFPYRIKRPGVATFGRAFSRDGESHIFR